MNIKFRNYFLILIVITGIWACGISLANADSDLFPPYEDAPALTSYVSGGVFNNTYYIASTGNDSTGDGSFEDPWATLTPANGTVSQGDRIYFRGGTYNVTVNNPSWMRAASYITANGTSTNYIIITNYPGETPIFEGGQQNYGGTRRSSFTIEGDYIVVNGLTFTTSGFNFNQAHHGVVQNCVFSEGAHLWGDQIKRTSIGLNNDTYGAIIRNNYFGPGTAHGIKVYTSESIIDDVQIIYNRFYGIPVSYGVIALKGVGTNWVIAYNRFENCNQGILFGTTYNQGTFSGFQIHHNAFDNVYTSIFERLGSSTKDIINVEFRDNIVLNASAGSRDVIMLKCTENGCMDSGSQSMGVFYNNAFYDLVDLIDPQTTSDFTNYPSYWNFNAYPSTSIRDSAENQNNLSASGWQGSSLIVQNHGINIQGASGNRFYSITDNSPLRKMGRYNDTIGGFEWGGTPDSPVLMP